MALIATAPETSRLHASRRIFTELAKHEAEEKRIPVIHHMVFQKGDVKAGTGRELYPL
jgi:hypothetical protein